MPASQLFRGLFVCAAVVTGCDREDAAASRSARASTQTSPPATENAWNPNLDVLARELAGAAACDRLRGQFRALLLPDETTATGTVWIRDCLETVMRNEATFAIGGLAWRGTGKTRDAVEFSFRSTGHLRVTYDTSARSLMITFEPTLPVSYSLLPLAPRAHDQRMDQGILHALAAALISPHGAPRRSTAPLDPRFAVAAKLSVCNPIPEFVFGTHREVEGSGDPHAIVELSGATPVLFGQLAAGSNTIEVQVERGVVHASAVCERDARLIATAIVEGKRLPRTSALVQRDIRGSARINIPPQDCPVTLMMRNARRSSRARVTWYVPPNHTAPSAELGPIALCATLARR